MDAIQQLRLGLETLPGLRLAVLFGSAAGGRSRAGSDIDVGIAMRAGFSVPPELRVTLERMVGRPVDLVLLDSAPPLLRFEIARHGVALAESSDGAWADFRARAMIDWWDWAPTARMMHETMKAGLEREVRRGPS